MSDAPAPESAPDAAGGVAPAEPDGLLVQVRRLERLLGDSRKHSLKATRQLHSMMLREVRDAEKRAKQAERRAERAEEKLAEARRRAKRAEAELAEVRASTTWKAGRAVVAVPARVRRRLGK